MDYSQNIYITNFGGEQSGSTYYFSPSSVYQHSIFERINGCDILYYYIYC